MNGYISCSRLRRVVETVLRGRLAFSTRPDAQEGFTIIEVLVASMVLMVALLSIAYVTTSSLAQVSFSRQRQVANNLATQTIEQVRALPFATVSSGLLSSDVNPATDPKITTCAPYYCYGIETIPTTSSAPPAPLDPHVAAQTIGGSTYTVSTYVTEYNNLPSPNVLRVTVKVSWSPAAIQGVASSVKAQTLVYSTSSGCLLNTSHPFASPCQPSFLASATDGSGQIQLTPDSAHGMPVSLTSASITPVITRDTMSIGQVSSVVGAVQNSHVSLAGTTPAAQGSAQVSASADNDPASSSTTYGTNSTVTQTTGTLSAPDAAGSTISVTGSGGDSGTAEATTSASSANACTDLSNLGIVNALPCSFETATQAAATSASLDVKLGSSDLGTASLVSVPSETTKAFTTYVTASGGTYCNGTSGDGCVDTRATRTVGTVTMGGLPSGVSPPGGWNGYLVQISGWTDTVRTEVGVGTVAPTVTLTGGTISYWAGGAYGTTTIGTNTQPTVAQVSRTGTLGGQTYTVTETVAAGGLNSGSATVSDPGSCTAPCTRQAVTSATSTSPQVTIDYQVVWGTENWGVSINFNLGSLSASGTYGVSPSAG